MEWVVFAGFALFIWWRLVKDDYRRDLEDALDEEQAGEEPPTGHPAADEPTDSRPTAPQPTDPRVQS